MLVEQGDLPPSPSKRPTRHGPRQPGTHDYRMALVARWCRAEAAGRGAQTGACTRHECGHARPQARGWCTVKPARVRPSRTPLAADQVATVQPGAAKRPNRANWASNSSSQVCVFVAGGKIMQVERVYLHDDGGNSSATSPKPSSRVTWPLCIVELQRVQAWRQYRPSLYQAAGPRHRSHHLCLLGFLLGGPGARSAWVSGCCSMEKKQARATLRIVAKRAKSAENGGPSQSRFQNHKLVAALPSCRQVIASQEHTLRRLSRSWRFARRAFANRATSKVIALGW